MLRHFREKSAYLEQMGNKFSPLFSILFIIALIGTVPSLGIAQMAAGTNPGLHDYKFLQSDDDEDFGGYYVNNPEDSSRGQNPTVALFKSLFVPGWGQLGNKKYIKAGIVIGLETTLIAAIVHHAKKTSDAKKVFENATDSTLIPGLFNDYENAKDKRNLYSWLTGTMIFVSMFDAYVDAHLANFPKYDKKLTLDLIPTGLDEIQAVIAYRF